MNQLKIAKNFNLPYEAVTQTFGILAKRGGGKTYTASVMAEEMLDNGLPVVIADPIGVWWGLRTSADGKKPGHSIIVFGGDHAHIAMFGFAGMDKKGRAASAGQCGGDFSANMARFAHADDHDTPLACEQQLTGFGEVLVDTVDQRRN